MTSEVQGSPYQDCTLKELRANARAKQVKYYYKLKKSELVDILSTWSPPKPLPEPEIFYEPRVQNIMCTVDLGCRLDLPHIAAHGYEYRPEKFNPVVMRLSQPVKFTTLIFASGKIVCTGVKDEDMAKKTARIAASKIRELGFPAAQFLNFRITNIVASCHLGFRPRFTKFYYRNIKFSEYEPEIFPGMYYRPTVTIIVFKSGKVIITNAKTTQQIYREYDAFRKKIRSSTLLQGRRGY